MAEQKLFWASNIKLLRVRKKLSQEDLAQVVGMTRAKINAHENGVSKNPPLEDLVKFSTYFKMAIDTLITVNLAKLHELKLRELEAGNDVYISGGRIRILPITVNTNNRENVEVVPIKAKAGYAAGYNDPEFISQLPKAHLPHLPENRTFRIFPTEGDSMLPFPENTFVISEYVQDWNTLRDTPCIVILSSEQGFLFKMVTLIAERQSLLLHSLNPVYYDQEVFAGDVLEVWKYHSHITDVVPSSQTMMQELLRTVQEIKVDVREIKNKA